MKQSIIYLMIAALVVVNVSCENEADPEADKRFFTKIYDNNIFNAAFTPLDAVQASDGGYIVLSIRRVIAADGTSVDPGVIQIMKTDALGAFVSQIEMEEDFITPAPSLLNVGGRFFFFCMTRSTFSTQLIEIDNNGRIAQQLALNPSLPLPLASGVDGTSLLLLTYDNSEKESVMSVVSTDGHIQLSKGYTIGAGNTEEVIPEDLVMRHVLRTGPRIPFKVGRVINNGPYYFIGLHNYTLSAVFTDLNADNPIGVIQGSQKAGGLSNLVPTAGGKYAAARFNYGDNYFMPSITVTGTGRPDATSFDGLAIPELVENAPVVIKTIPVNGVDKVIYGSNTRGKQISLFAYNPSDGVLSGSRYIGFSNTFEIASLTSTSDEGLLVLGTTYVAGRFPRICLFKLSAESLRESFK